MTSLAWALASALWGLAAIHLFWGAGGTWPATDEASLARTVVGAPGIKRMPSAGACLVVAIALAAIGLWPLAAIGAIAVPLPGSVTAPIGMACAAMFLLRGAAAYVPAWRRLVPEQPFATLDRAVYGPLCLALAAGYAALLRKGFV